MIVEKLISKRGQISMELSILVAAAVAVAAIAAYYYISTVKNNAENVDTTAANTIDRLGQTTSNFTDQMPTAP